VSGGPPPVPGGRTPEEREAARREREARRAGRDGAAPAAPAEPPRPVRVPQDDWLAEAERLTRRPAAGDSDAPPPPRRRPRGGDRPRPRVGRLIALAVVLAVLGAAGWFLLSLFQPFKGDGEGSVRVVIPEGAGVGEIGELLEQRGVISNSSFFELRARLSGRSGDLKPGPFTLQRNMSYSAVLDRLEEGVPPNVVMVTIPEGRSRGEITPLVRKLDGNYRRATRRSPLLDPRDYGAKGATSLEGFLFPSTYELKKGQPVRKLVDQQLTKFKQTFESVDLSYAKSKKLTAYDVLIIASLVEREAAVAKERPLIASVIYNRLKNDMQLDIDATTRFAVGNWDSPLKVSELNNPSPYNTRMHAGLPPGPIGNPGLDSIRAAARPAKTDYLFYVAVICGGGKHRFAETDAEFQRHVDAYERERAKRGGKAPTNC
jgi:UPF0755 protein